MPVIHIAAALTTDDRGSCLLVRKRGTSAFMQPGGKIEPGEEPLDALRRELYEELRLTTARADYTEIGVYDEDAANEPGHRVHAHVYRLVVGRDVPVPSAEIAEARWVDPRDTAGLDVAPLTRRHLLPLLST